MVWFLLVGNNDLSNVFKLKGECTITQLLDLTDCTNLVDLLPGGKRFINEQMANSTNTSTTFYFDKYNGPINYIGDILAMLNCCVYQH